MATEFEFISSRELGFLTKHISSEKSAGLDADAKQVELTHPRGDALC